MRSIRQNEIKSYFIIYKINKIIKMIINSSKLLALCENNYIIVHKEEWVNPYLLILLSLNLIFSLR